MSEIALLERSDFSVLAVIILESPLQGTVLSSGSSKIRSPPFARETENTHCEDFLTWRVLELKFTGKAKIFLFPLVCVQEPVVSAGQIMSSGVDHEGLREMSTVSVRPLKHNPWSLLLWECCTGKGPALTPQPPGLLLSLNS